MSQGEEVGTTVRHLGALFGSLRSVDQQALTQVHWPICKISGKTEMFMAKSETIFRVTNDAGCPLDTLFNLAPENSILDSVIYFSYSGIISDCFSETKS